MPPQNPDWYDWHEAYRPGSESHLVRRLAVVQRFLATALVARPPGPIRVASLCAGQGDDVLGVLADHPRAADVTAVLVETDERNAAAAGARIEELNLNRVHVVVGDAGNTSSLADVVPCDVLLLCGMLGNISMADVESTIAAAPELLTAGATVLWTRRTVPTDVTPRIRGFFAAAGFTELGFVKPDDDKFAVGCQRLDAMPRPFVPDRQLFDFVGYAALIERGE
jgi:hypothetical protein